MAKVRISNTFGTIENEYSGDGLAIHVDGQMVFPVNGGAMGNITHVEAGKPMGGNVAPAPGSSASTPVIPQGASELGILTTIWNGKVDAAGNLLGKDGQIITEPDRGETLKDSYPSAQALLDDAARINYTGTVKIDGEVHHQGSPAVVGYEVRADGTAHRMAQSPAPVVAPITLPEIPEGDASDQHYQIAAPASGQVLTRTNGLTTGYALFEFTVPKPYPFPTAGKLGFLRITERPGSDVIPRAMTVYVNGATAFSNYDSGDTAPSVDISMGGKHSGAMVGLEPGDVARVSVRNIGYRPGHPADILFDLALPGRNG